MALLRSSRRAGEPAAQPAAGPTPAALKSRALRWLAQRDHSRVELERKLLAHARALARLAEAAAEAAGQADASLFPDSLLRERIGVVLDGLAAAGLMNEPRMAEALLASRAPRLGERRLRQVMQQRGLAPALVDATVTQARGSEFERAQALWQRRFGGVASTPAEQARQMRFLAGRGFASHVIRRVVRTSGVATELPPEDDEPA